MSPHGDITPSSFLLRPPCPGRSMGHVAGGTARGVALRPCPDPPRSGRWAIPAQVPRDGKGHWTQARPLQDTLLTAKGNKPARPSPKGEGRAATRAGLHHPGSSPRRSPECSQPSARAGGSGAGEPAHPRLRPPAPPEGRPPPRLTGAGRPHSTAAPARRGPSPPPLSRGREPGSGQRRRLPAGRRAAGAPPEGRSRHPAAGQRRLAWCWRQRAAPALHGGSPSGAAMEMLLPPV